MTVISDARVVTPDGVLDPGWVHVEGRRITAVGTGSLPGGADVSLPGRWVVPGFVDVHCHGGAGADHASGLAEDVGRAVAWHRRHGTTTTLASLVTAPLDEIASTVRRLAPLVGDGVIAGIHLEGPFLSPQRRGAHDPRLLIPPDRDSLRLLLGAAPGAVTMCTLAPELPGGLDAVRLLVDAGVVAAIGHTDAGYDTTRAAIDAGARAATHVFNGMAPIHHRHPGPVVALLEDRRVTVELINDGVHLHPATLRSVVACVGPERAALVTDAISATGSGEGRHRLGSMTVDVADGVARLAEGGSLAGSTLTMDRAVRRGVRDVGLSLEVAVAMASSTPARLIGLADRVGAIAAGLDADLVVLDAHLGVERVMAKGSWVR